MNKPGTPPPPPRKPTCIVTKPATPGGMPSVQCFKGTQTVAFVAPVARMGSPLSSPTSGPASGLWASNNPTPPAPTPTPTPPPTPSCVAASILADCFPCTGGPINSGTPGPVCGWTFSNAFGGKGGSVSFTPGVMHMDSAANNDTPAATKPITFPSVNNITYQATFTEYPAPTGGGFSFYQFFLVGTGATYGFDLRMVDNGTLFLSIGPTVGASVYSGSWTPNNGTHEVHLTVSAGGVPTLYLDGVVIPLTFLLIGGINFGTMPGDVAAIYMGSGNVFPDSASVTSVFVTSGVFPPTTEFCCS